MNTTTVPHTPAVGSIIQYREHPTTLGGPKIASGKVQVVHQDHVIVGADDAEEWLHVPLDALVPADAITSRRKDIISDALGYWPGTGIQCHAAFDARDASADLPRNEQEQAIRDAVAEAQDAEAHIDPTVRYVDAERGEVYVDWFATPVPVSEPLSGTVQVSVSSCPGDGDPVMAEIRGDHVDLLLAADQIDGMIAALQRCQRVLKVIGSEGRQ